MKKKGFTLVELLIVIFVISTGLILIIKGVSESHRYLSETAQRTVALNLAKEGIEAVYNLRNSNWRRRPDKKNECWITNIPLDQNDENDPNCETTGSRLQAGWTYMLSGYTLSGAWWLIQQDAPLLSGIFKVNIDSPYLNLGSYYRVISINSLWDKENWNTLNWCKNGNISIWWKKCGGTTPKELRFCSKVLYTKPYSWEVHVCAIMTNFEQ